MLHPKVSVVMPAYNAERYISRAIESILNQTFKDFELIIINDASTDSTLSIINKYIKKDKRIKVISNKKNLQIAASLNIGITKAKSNIVARMDADDYSIRNRLELQYKLLEKHSDIAIVGAYMYVVNEQNKVLTIRKYPTKSDDLKKVMFRYSPFAHPVVMYRKKVIQEFGGYSLGIFPCEDYELWFKVGSKYKFATIPKPLLRYTNYENSSSHRNLKNIELLGLRIKIMAIVKLGYTPTIYDLIFNLCQYLTLWFVPSETRVRLFNFIRGRGLI